jgi:hypothetical protein
VVAGPDRHLDARLAPPVEAGADREDDALLRRRLMAARGDDQARAPDAVLVELLDHDLVEKGAKLMADRLGRVGSLGRAQAVPRAQISNS